MNIKTNRKYWEGLLLKNKENTKKYLQEGMIYLKSIPPGKSLSLFIGGKFEKEKENKINNENINNNKEKKLEEHKNNNNIKDESFNLDNFLNSENINELFGLDDNSKIEKENIDLNVNRESQDIKNNLDIEKEDKTNDKTYNNNNISDNNIFHNYREKENINLNFNINNENKNINININNNNSKNFDDSYIDYELDIQNMFKDDFNFNFDNKYPIQNDINNINEIQQKKINSEVIPKHNNKNNINNIYQNNNNTNKTSYDVEKNLEEFGKEFEWDEEVEICNEKTFGYKKFRPIQREIINASLSNRDIFVCMPTGGGKSLAYQIPALVSEGVTIIVMPLLSLIQDQTTYLNGCGLKVLFLNNENMMNLDYDKSFHSENEEDRCKMIFLTPEKIAKSAKTMDLLNSLYNEGLLERCVVDEAHCVSQWGREFRSDYLNLKILKQKFPNLPILALTATAPNKIRDDVINQLGMKNTVFFRSSYNRKNLYIEIRKKCKGYINDIAKFIKEKYPNDSGLIYCSTKKNCEDISKELKNKHKIKCDFYHASIPEQKKNKIQEKWKNNQIQVIVATVAFGMGINKSDVRFVIHNSMPNSFESYYQEIGRAGRDGNNSHCLLYYSPGDRKSVEFLISTTNLDKNKLSESLRKITQMVDYCEEQFQCRRVIALEYFDEKFDSKYCNQMCDNCNKNLNCEKRDCTKLSLIILNFVKNCSDKFMKITVAQSIDYLIGKNGKQHMGWPLDDKNKGVLNKIPVENIKKIIRKLIILGYIDEFLVKNRDNVYSRIEISQKGKNYYYMKNNNPENNIDNIFISFKGEKKKENEDKDNSDNSEEEDVIDESSHMESTIKKEEENNDISNKKDSSEKRNNNKTSGRKKKKKKNEINIDEEDFGLCENKKLFDELFAKLKKKRGNILCRENGIINDDDDDDENYNLSVFKEKKNLGLDDIFTDNGLKELCRKLPTLDKELNNNNIFGVNKKSLKEYGKEFLPLIIEFIEEKGINKEDLKKIKKEKEETEKKNKKNKKREKSEKKSGKKGKNKNKKEEKEKEIKEENKENNIKEEGSDIIIPENGIYNLNLEDEGNLLYQINEAYDEIIDEIPPKEDDKEINGEDFDDEELEKMKEEINSQKERIEQIDEDYLSQAKDLAKNNMKKFKRSQLDDDDDDDSKGGKKGLKKYNFFQRRAILKKMHKGKAKWKGKKKGKKN